MMSASACLSLKRPSPEGKSGSGTVYKKPGSKMVAQSRSTDLDQLQLVAALHVDGLDETDTYCVVLMLIDRWIIQP